MQSKQKAFVFQWRDALLEAPELIANDRHIATLFLKYFSPGGRNAYPGTRLLVTNSARSKATVLSCLGWLIQSGWLEVETKGAGHKATVYRAAIPAVRLSRAHRKLWARERKQRLAAEKASRSKTLPSTESVVGLNGDGLVGLNGDASGSKRETPNTLEDTTGKTEEVLPSEGVANGDLQRVDTVQEENPRTTLVAIAACWCPGCLQRFDGRTLDNAEDLFFVHRNNCSECKGDEQPLYERPKQAA